MSIKEKLSKELEEWKERERQRQERIKERQEVSKTKKEIHKLKYAKYYDTAKIIGGSLSKGAGTAVATGRVIGRDVGAFGGWVGKNFNVPGQPKKTATKIKYKKGKTRHVFKGYKTIPVRTKGGQWTIKKVPIVKTIRGRKHRQQQKSQQQQKQPRQENPFGFDFGMSNFGY